jgi:hypothetical protein
MAEAYGKSFGRVPKFLRLHVAAINIRARDESGDTQGYWFVEYRT